MLIVACHAYNYEIIGSWSNLQISFTNSRPEPIICPHNLGHYVVPSDVCYQSYLHIIITFTPYLKGKRRCISGIVALLTVLWYA